MPLLHHQGCSQALLTQLGGDWAVRRKATLGAGGGHGRSMPKWRGLPATRA